MLLKTAAITAFAVLLPVSSGLADDQETQELHNNTYQQFANTTCAYQGDCAVFFPATTHTNTVITNVSCSFAVPSGTNLLYAAVSTESASPRFFVPTFYYGYNAGIANYGINGAINLFVAHGDRPRVDVYAVGGVMTGLNCTISGYHS